MAQLPDAMDLGERRIGDGRAPITIDRSGEIAVEGLSRAADNLNAAVQRYAQHDDAFNYALAKSELQGKDVELRSKYQDDPDWATQESRYSEEMKVAREDAGKKIRGARSRALFDMDAKVDVDRGTAQIRSQAKVAEGQWGRSKLDETLASNRTAALEAKDEATRASLMTSVQDSINGALMNRYITPEQAKNLQQTWAASYGEGFVDVEPSDAEKLKLLRDPKKNPVQFIDPDKRQEMIRVIENRQRVESDRRVSEAERAYAQAERQISSGVPASAAVWSGWGAKIKGTPIEADFRQLIDAEKEVQTTLRMPIADQQRILQEREAKLMTGGGSMQDALNFNRLERAVKQNIALIQNAPLVYGEQRNGDQNVPLDITGVVDPNQQQATSAVLQDRAARIGGMRKTLGAAVPMKPLLPQEAGQLVNVLDSAKPQQAAQIFAGLSQAAGSVDVYKGIMSQIAPDAPVKAHAGLLASNQRELVTGNSWFAPDPFVKSTDVAATMLRGDQLLNPSKQDKTEDGKPKTRNLLLPSEAQASLQAQFSKEVGTAFAGRSEDADRAYQAVQAYYVGRADQLGKLAQDSQTVNTALVREAVRNTLGNVVDYNGQVLAPWGMTADDFEDRIEKQFAEVAKREHVPDGVTPNLSSFGLVNADREGRYAVRLGEKFLFDSKGNPLILDITPPAQLKR